MGVAKGSGRCQDVPRHRSWSPAQRSARGPRSGDVDHVSVAGATPGVEWGWTDRSRK